MENKTENTNPATAPQGQPVVNKPAAARPAARPAGKPAPKPQKPEKPKSSGGNTGLIVFLVITIFILLGGIGYLVYDKLENQKLAGDMQQSNETLKTDFESKVAEINRLEDSIKVVIAEKEALGQELTEERAKLAELEDLKGQLQNHQVSINSLNSKLSHYKKQHSVISASLESLQAENEKLVAEKQVLGEALKAKDDSLKIIGELKAQLAKRTEAATSNASSVKMDNINVVVINTTGKELPAAATYKSMVVLKVKMNLKLSSPQTGKKEVYLRFVEPSGTAAFEGEKIFIAEGKKTFYTEKQTVNFESGTQSILFTYNKGSRYKPGKYNIEIYADSKLIGNSSLVLTK